MNSTTHGYGVLSTPQQDHNSEELLRRLIHRMARTMGAFRSTTQALLNGADEDPRLRRELLQEMEFELGELQRLLDNVTQFKSLEKGTFALNRQELPVRPWLHQLVSRWQRTAPDKALTWVVDIADNLPVLLVDVEKLEQALNNILANAVKHSPEGARVTIEAWVQGGDFRVRISTNPARLVPGDYDHLSELFYTGEGQGRFPTGVGLGLYVTRALIERHGGMLRVAPPTSGENSVGFELSVPMSTEIGRGGAATHSVDNILRTHAATGDTLKSMR